MNATIGVYDTHEKAIEEVEVLKRAGFPVQQLSLIGKAAIIDDLLRVKNNRWVKNAPVMIGAILGPILGILTGVKLFAIPGLGFLFGIGAIIGALAGFSIGIACGGIVSLITTLAVKTRTVVKYREHIEERGFQVIVHGNQADITKAKTILESNKR